MGTVQEKAIGAVDLKDFVSKLAGPDSLYQPRFLGVAEWTFGLLLLLGFWNKQLGILGALGACFTFIATSTIIPFMPDGWAPSAGGFPAMTEKVAFLMKDLVLLAASFYLLRQDVLRAASARELYRDLQDAATVKEGRQV